MNCNTCDAEIDEEIYLITYVDRQPVYTCSSCWMQRKKDILKVAPRNER